MDNKIGLWKKTSQKGKEYFAGKLLIENEEYSISLFKNEYKENDKQPDYQMIVNKKEKKENKKEKTSYTLDEIEFANFGNEVNDIKDEDIAF